MKKERSEARERERARAKNINTTCLSKVLQYSRCSSKDERKGDATGGIEQQDSVAAYSTGASSSPITRKKYPEIENAHPRAYQPLHKVPPKTLNLASRAYEAAPLNLPSLDLFLLYLLSLSHPPFLSFSVALSFISFTHPLFSLTQSLSLFLPPSLSLSVCPSFTISSVAVFKVTSSREFISAALLWRSSETHGRKVAGTTTECSRNREKFMQLSVIRERSDTP